MPAARLSPDHPTTSPLPIQKGSEPADGSVESPFLERLPSTVYVTAGVASSKQSRSLFRAWKSQERQGNNDRSCWGGGKPEGESHSIALLSRELQLRMNMDPSRLPRVPALPRVQEHRADAKMILRYCLGFWNKGACDSHTRLGGSPSTDTHSADESVGTEAGSPRGQPSPPLVLGTCTSLSTLQQSFSHLTHTNLSLQTNPLPKPPVSHRLQNYFV